MPLKREMSKVDQQIDENLKRVYDDRIERDVPDRFKALIAQLKEQTGGNARVVEETSFRQ